MRRALFVTACLLACCARQLEHVDPPPRKPAFLGAASGFYLVRHETAAQPPLFSTVVQVDRTILLTLGTVDSVGDGLSIFGELSEEGALVAKAQVRVADALPHVAGIFPAIAETMVTAEAALVVGFDTVGLALQLEDDAGRRAVCAAYTAAGLSSECAALEKPMTFVASKVCDFDPRISGVYDATIEKVGGPAECGAFAGARDLVVVATAAAPSAAIFVVDDGTIETAALLRYDPASQSLVTPPGGTLSITAKLAVGAKTTTVTAQSTNVDGCVLSVSATRLTGEKGGLSCTRLDLCEQLEATACPTVPRGILAVYDYEGKVDTGLACQVPICRATLETKRACDAASPAVVSGCPLDTTTVITAGQATNGEPCYRATCVAKPSCADRPDISVDASACTPELFVVRNVLGCQRTCR